MEQAIVEAPPQEVVPSKQFDIEALFTKAIAADVSVDTLERMMAMRREVKAEYAKEEFDRAMAKFQSECPVIMKNKKVSFNGGGSYSYAPLDDIVQQTGPIITRHGFSYTFDTEETENAIAVLCKVKHELGHSEVSRFRIGIDSAGKMNKSQQYGSALTYGKRYAFCNAFGILTGDEDNDAQYTNQSQRAAKPARPKVSDAQLKKIKDLVELKNYTKDEIIAKCKQMGFATLTGGPDGSASKLIGWLMTAPVKEDLPTIQIDDEPLDPETQAIVDSIPF